MAFATAQHPDVMLGPIPFYTAQMIEVASSEDVLKFRSVGAQFLAHQHGGNYAIRIDLKLIGECTPASSFPSSSILGVKKSISPNRT